MATRSFGDKAGAKTSGGAQPEASSVENGGLKREGGDAQAPTAAEQPNTNSTLANPLAPGFAGAWDRKDIRLPRVNLIHKTSKGELIEKFGIGSFVLNQEVKLSDGKTPIIITALRAAKDYQQKLPFGSEDEPKMVNTPEEVERAGGTIQYSRQAVAEKNYFGPRAHIQLIFALPEGASEEDAALFPYEFDGKTYGMAMFTVASSAYTSVGKELATLCNNNKIMRKGMQYGRLELTSEGRKKGDLDWKVPVIKYAGENPEELVKFFGSLL
jgi:hypothetical protein